MYVVLPPGAALMSRTFSPGCGSSAMTGHIRFVFNGIEDLRPLVRNMSDDDLRMLLDGGLPHRTEAEIWDELMRVTNNQADEELLQVHVSESLNTVQWLASKGHDWVPASLTNDNVLTMNGGGAGLQKRNFDILGRAGCVFHYETAATELLEDRTGRVTGVRAPGQLHQIATIPSNCSR